MRKGACERIDPFYAGYKRLNQEKRCDQRAPYDQGRETDEKIFGAVPAAKIGRRGMPRRKYEAKGAQHHEYTNDQ